MADHDLAGTVWTDNEVDLIVAGYFQMLGFELSGKSYVKSHKNVELQQETGRTRGSIEYKHQNISAVLDRLGLPWIQGYKPLVHYQESLVSGIWRYLDENPEISSGETKINTIGLAEPAALYFEPPPSLTTVSEVAEPLILKRLVQKFDPAERDARNRELGKLGEERIFLHERSNLTNAGRSDLARKVRWVSHEDGDGAGFDVLSFSPTGAERLLEVKTTTGYRKTPFYLTENERSLSVEKADAFRLVRLYDFARSPKVFELIPPLRESVILRPTNYRASFG